MSGLVRGLATLMVLAALVLAPRPGSRPADAARRPAAKLEGGVSSQAALVERFLEALRQNDASALHGLRVTETEYLSTILPGSVEPGQPIRAWPPDANQYFWGILDTKSRYSEAHLLEEYGGRIYHLKATEFAKGTKTYATYDAYRQLRLVLTGEDGEDVRLSTGSIAELGGQWKFISFVRE
jgi:hypothetical protein